MPAPEHGGDWGILGGTFDPIHYGHLSLAEEICRKKDLDGVLMVPSFRHPFKNAYHSSYEDRLAMLRLAIAEHTDLVASEIEKEANLPGYTLSTIRALKDRYAQTSFYFLMGEDNLDDLNRWYKPHEIITEVKILVGCRPPHMGNRDIGISSDRIEMVETRQVDVSSSQVRKMLKEKASVEELDKLISPEVQQYISDKGLYR